MLYMHAYISFLWFHCCLDHYLNLIFCWGNILLVFKHWFHQHDFYGRIMDDYCLSKKLSSMIFVLSIILSVIQSLMNLQIKKHVKFFFLGIIPSIFSLMKMEYHRPKNLFVITLVIYFYINEKINPLGIK